MKRMIFALLLVIVLVAGFHLALSRWEQDRQKEELALLRDALRRSAAACYASEGFYPPDVAYMQRHYGLTYDEDRYTVVYDRFASNLMPDITVLENAYDE